jgi:hypothetical protein
MGDYFHHDFQIGLQTYMHKYMGVNLGYTTRAQKQVRMWAQVKQQSQGC